MAGGFKIKKCRSEESTPYYIEGVDSSLRSEWQTEIGQSVILLNKHFH